MIYLSTYFNFCNSELRRKLTQEFMDRYPWIILLQNGGQASLSGGHQASHQASLACDLSSGHDIQCPKTVHYSIDEVGFIDYIMINKYLASVPADDVCIIDSDLILGPNFTSLAESMIKSFDFVHGFNHCYELIGDRLVYCAPSWYLDKFGGHTGYIYIWSKNFIRTFPECFNIGGFDYILARLLTGRSIDLVPKHMQMSISVLAGAKYGVLPLPVVHVNHGPKHLVNFKDYFKSVDVIDRLRKRCL